VQHAAAPNYLVPQCGASEESQRHAQRLCYAHQTIEHGWTRNVFVHQVERDLCERYRKAITNLARTMSTVQSGPARSLIKADPYDFRASNAVWQAILTNGFLPYSRLGSLYSTNGPYARTNQTTWIETAVHVIRRYTNADLWGTNTLRYVKISNEPDNANF